MQKKNAGNKQGLEEYAKQVASGVSNSVARSTAASIFGAEGVPVWDWEAPRTKEGYFHFVGGVDAAVKRVNLFAPYADLLWLETKTPDVKEATGFAKRNHDVHPDKKLVYNLSPSFNWSAHGFDGACPRLSPMCAATDAHLSLPQTPRSRASSGTWRLPALCCSSSRSPACTARA